MGREVRMVKPDWEHPTDGTWGDGSTRYKPLFEGKDYAPRVRSWMTSLAEKGLQETIDYEGSPPDKNDFMPVWTEEEATHFMMYSTTTEGHPISPAFPTPEELARWLADTGASSFGSMTATYEQWLSVARGGWAPSAVVTDGVLMSGVEAMGDST